MTRGRRSRGSRVAVLLALLPVLTAAAGCGDEGGEAAVAEAAPSGPATPGELERLVVDEVPSGLPRVPDEAIEPPAGEKSVADVAGYSDDPERERAVLEDYGYRHGWERFWGAGTGPGPQTGVFVDQFEAPAGADSYAEDLARNDAEQYGGLLSERSPGLPDGCRRLLVDEPDPDDGLWGPAAFAWCTHGPFSVAVSAVAGSLDDATEEVGAVARDQLARLSAA
ncbi:hypothetical protein DQ239_11330 [Blastococcus sp. TF02-09]|uniref:hypothetical protein n=1 Tax=Blastococcus sp. TF02-09 TaxID=2250576 RepID=UPI000DE9588E|nr:hypothetical protein [Blastococcus sp. TF02-9]RBY77460.1 hypothetical protein DQ239_11330 [Blastococcus sp. TF02-9]